MSVANATNQDKTPIEPMTHFHSIDGVRYLGFKLGFFFRTIFTPTMSDEF